MNPDAFRLFSGVLRWNKQDVFASLAMDPDGSAAILSMHFSTNVKI